MSGVILEIDGREVEVAPGTTLLEASDRLGIDVPTLCHEPRMAPAGVCRLCMVRIEGERLPAAACVRAVEPGMRVRTSDAALERARAQLVSLLASDQPRPSPRQRLRGDDELAVLPSDPQLDVARGQPRGRDESSAVIAVDHQACVLCDRCIRACDDLQVNHVIGRVGKGYETRIGFDFDQPMGASSCVSCGECAAVCPTGALISRPEEGTDPTRSARDTVDSVCPYCGVGCAVRYHVDRSSNRVSWAEGRDEAANAGRLCVKGRYGHDYASHPQRLTRPLIRTRYPKGPLTDEVAQSTGKGRRKRRGAVDYARILPAFREASWDEALAQVSERLSAIKAARGPGALAGFGSAKCTNEEAYLFQKLVRAVFGTNNVDHCTRLCHASSVSALLQMIGSGAVTTTFTDIANADFAIIAGCNPTANHPVAATFFKQAAAAGTQLLVVNPMHVPIVEHAWRFCQIRPGSDVAFYNGLMNVVIEEGLVDREYVARFTRDFEVVEQAVERYTPELVSGVCGVPAETIREVGLAIGGASAAIAFWGMGLSQHVHGTDNCRALISLLLMTGNVGRAGTGLHPLRGQNNVQGASDAGLIPMSYPDYRPTSSAEAHAHFEAAWGRPLSTEPGLTTVEIMEAAAEGEVRGMYILGENPFLSDPNTNAVRTALSRLDFLAVQDIFLTETAEFADVILPATSALEKSGTFTNTDRRVQLVRPALEPPGDARPDWSIICEIGSRMGYPMQYEGPAEIFDEWVSHSRSYRGLSHAMLGQRGRLYPCPEPELGEGTVVMFGEGFPTADGRARFVPAEHTGADELPDDVYPLILVTGRELEHWHTGVMTRRSRALDAIRPDARVTLHPDDANALGVSDGALVRVASRRGEIRIEAWIDDGTQPGSVFIPFHYREAAANVLTTDALDPDGKIPEFKFCAVRIEPLECQEPASRALRSS